jgi:hypothetical protein
LSLPDRLAASEGKLDRCTVDAATNEAVSTGANLRLLNSLRFTDTMNGMGNLIMGYNEPRKGGENRRTGSHKGRWGSSTHEFSSFGGLVVGLQNEVSGAFAAVSGGVLNRRAGKIGGTGAFRVAFGNLTLSFGLEKGHHAVQGATHGVSGRRSSGNYAGKRNQGERLPAG